MEHQDNFWNELDEAFANNDDQTVEQVLNSLKDHELKECVKTLVKWIKSYKGSDQTTCIEILLNKLREAKINVDIEDKDEATLLMQAAQKG